MAKVNSYNFLRWYDATIDSNQPALPHAYWTDREHCGYMPIAYPTEALAFYVNTSAGANYGTFSDMRLRMKRVDTGAIVDNNILGLAKHDLTTPNYNFFATIVIPSSTTGHHYFEIYNNATSTVILTSSYVFVRTDKTELDKETIFCRFRHDRQFYNIKYGDLPSFYQQFRLHMSIDDRQVQTDKDIYKEVTTGKVREWENYLSRFYKIEAYYFDQDGHEAASVMVEHSYKEFNGKLYTWKSAWKEISNPRSKLTKGEFEVWDEEFNSVNRC